MVSIFGINLWNMNWPIWFNKNDQTGSSAGPMGNVKLSPSFGACRCGLIFIWKSSILKCF